MPAAHNVVAAVAPCVPLWWGSKKGEGGGCRPQGERVSDTDERQPQLLSAGLGARDERLARAIAAVRGSSDAAYYSFDGMESLGCPRGFSRRAVEIWSDGPEWRDVICQALPKRCPVLRGLQRAPSCCTG